MLGFLKKLKFNPAELADKDPAALRRYFRYFAETQQVDVLEKVWPYVAAEKKANTLSDALMGVYFSLVYTPDRGAFKWILDKVAEEKHSDVTEYYFDDEMRLIELTQNITDADDAELLDHLLEFAEEHRGREGVRGIIDAGLWSGSSPHIADKLILLAQERDEDDLLQNVMGSTYAFSRIVNMVPFDEGGLRLEAAVHWLKLQYEHAGEEAVVGSFNDLSEMVSREDIETEGDIYVALFKALVEIGGNGLLKGVLSDQDYNFVERVIGQSRIDGVIDAVKDLALQTQDREFLDKVCQSLEKGWYAGYA